MAAPPLEDENLLPEILLLLPPEPSSLPRASAVCKRWRGVVSDRRFIRRFRLHHRRNAPLLGFFSSDGGESFQPTLQTPNRVSPGRFSFQQDRGELRSRGCRDGLMLLLDPKRKQALVWDPVTGDQDRIALPPRFDNLAQGAVLRAAGDVHFQFQVVLVASDCERVLGCVYSSETGLWGNLISTALLSTSILARKPAVLVRDSLHWILIGQVSGILEFDLERLSQAVIPLPMYDMFQEEKDIMVMPAEGGGLGVLLVSGEDLSAQLWKRKTDCDMVASWELGRTIEMAKLLSLNLVGERKFLRIFGFAECNSVTFLKTAAGLFMVELESLQFKKVSEAPDLHRCEPFESVYAAGI
ncbi:unnamed protein product [Alopecurus aequalis]